MPISEQISTRVAQLGSGVFARNDQRKEVYRRRLNTSPDLPPLLDLSLGSTDLQPPPVALAPELNASLQRAIDSLIKTGPNLLNQMNKGPSSATGSQNSQPSNSGGGGGYQYSSYGRDSF